MGGKTTDRGDKRNSCQEKEGNQSRKIKNLIAIYTVKNIGVLEQF